MDRRGELGPLMWLLIGIMVLVAVILVVITLKDKSFGIIGTIRDAV